MPSPEPDQRRSADRGAASPLQSLKFERNPSLGIFADRSHPSAHGGRAKEGFSVWGVMNKAKSKPGERLLRSWFARPTHDETV